MSSDRPDDRFDVALQLLDRQLVAGNGELLGNVDNALLAEVDGMLTLTALLTGPLGFAGRLKGRPQQWMSSIWRSSRHNPTPTVIPLDQVTGIGPEVILQEPAHQLVADGAVLERWLRHHVISRIPGATGRQDRLSGEPLDAAGTALPVPAREQARTGGHLISDLIGARVLTSSGKPQGWVLDVITTAPSRDTDTISPLAVTRLLYGRRRLAAQLGYRTQPRQAPWIIAAPLRRWHHTDQLASIDHVRIDWTQTPAVVTIPD